MDTKNILEKRRIAMAYAKKRGREDIADDFAQWVVLWMVEHPDQDHVHFDCRFADFFRSEYGSGTPNSKRFNWKRMIDNCEADYPDPAPLRQLQWREVQDIYRLLEDPLDRILLSLLHFYGYEQQEIAEMAGVSEGRISQMFAKLAEKIPRARGRYTRRKR